MFPGRDPADHLQYLDVNVTDPIECAETYRTRLPNLRIMLTLMSSVIIDIVPENAHYDYGKKMTLTSVLRGGKLTPGLQICAGGKKGK